MVMYAFEVWQHCYYYEYITEKQLFIDAVVHIDLVHSYTHYYNDTFVLFN